LTDLIFDAPDISDAQVKLLIQQLRRVYELKTLNQILSIEEISQFQNLLDQTTIEDQWFKTFLSSFYPVSVFNGEASLGRMLLLCFYSRKPYFLNFGLHLIQNPELTKFSIVNAFRQIIAMQEVDSVFQDTELAANYWINLEGVHEDLKAAFLLSIASKSKNYSHEMDSREKHVVDFSQMDFGARGG